MSDEYEEIEVYEDEFGNLTDSAGHPVDEDGNRLTVSAQPMPVAPQTPAPGPAPTPRVPKALLAGAAALVLVLGGGAVYGMAQIGGQNTATQVVEKVQEKKEQKVEQVTRPELDACTDLARAAWSSSSAVPTAQLTVVASAPLPGGMIERLGAAGAGEVVMLQTGRDAWGLYVAEPAAPKGTVPTTAPWWAVAADTRGDTVVMTEGPGEGGDVDVAGACKQAKAGAYRMTGEVPASAEGLKGDQVTVTALKADGGAETVVWAVVGDQLVKTQLEYAPDSDDDDDGEVK